MKTTITFLFFLALNFGALGLGTLLMGDAVTGTWYQNLNKAPWTPPGWVFGAAWTTIMLLFSVFMALQVADIKTALSFRSQAMQLYWPQWILNVSWNYIFFNQQLALPGLLVIVLLTGIVWLMTIRAFTHKPWTGLLLLPYGIWLLIATSLNAYIWWMN
jgi:tryptophan-rich sensory protein